MLLLVSSVELHPPGKALLAVVVGPTLLAAHSLQLSRFTLLIAPTARVRTCLARLNVTLLIARRAQVHLGQFDVKAVPRLYFSLSRCGCGKVPNTQLCG